MGIKEFGDLIANQGFAIAVCIWFMFRNEKVINSIKDSNVSLTSAINNLTTIVQTLIKKDDEK